MLWLFLEREEVLGAGLDVLHFSPEPAIERRLRRWVGLRYRTADLEPGRADLALDLTGLACPDASLDRVLACHILEHVQDDAGALRELHRVLRPGGRVLLQHPMHTDRPTFENPQLTTADERHAAFSQPDHVRVYGNDFGERLEAAGFRVELRRYRDELPPAERRRFRLESGTTFRADDIYVAHRP